MTEARRLVDNFFRRESARLIGSLTRSLGLANLELAEDCAQAALLQAMQNWSRNGIPENPHAWVYRVAKSRALDTLRRQKRWDRIANQIASELPADGIASEADHIAADSAENEPLDDTLRMMFWCCHPKLPPESRIALALRTLCGFGPKEIAAALLTSPANIEKRLVRARSTLRETAAASESDDDSSPKELSIEIDPETVAERLPDVLTTIYLLFSEGYASSGTERALHDELCHEAVRLTEILANDPRTGTPAVHAMTGLLMLHLARLPGRLSSDGDWLLLPEQDRSKWNHGLISLGLQWMHRSGVGDQCSQYHVEAAIAAEHCIAASYPATNWTRIVELYELLYALQPSAIHALNRAVALAELHGPAIGLKSLDAAVDSNSERLHLWPAIRGEFLRRLQDWAAAEREFAMAIRLCRSPADRRLLARRWEECRTATESGPSHTTDSHPA